MLLDKDYEPNEDERIDKAFKHMGENPDDEARFDSYVRGGVDVLYEKLIEGVSSPDEYVTRLYDFIEEFQEKFNDEISSDDKECFNITGSTQLILNCMVQKKFTPQ